MVQYLAVTHKIPLRRFVTPMGYGKTEAVADNTTASGRSQNRRVEVKMIINRGLSQQPAASSTHGRNGRIRQKAGAERYPYLLLLALTRILYCCRDTFWLLAFFNDFQQLSPLDTVYVARPAFVKKPNSRAFREYPYFSK